MTLTAPAYTRRTAAETRKAADDLTARWFEGLTTSKRDADRGESIRPRSLTEYVEVEWDAALGRAMGERKGSWAGDSGQAHAAILGEARKNAKAWYVSSTDKKSLVDWAKARREA